MNKIIARLRANKLNNFKSTDATTIDVFSENIIPESYFENLVNISKNSNNLMLLSKLIRESKFKTVKRNVKKYNSFESYLTDNINSFSNTAYNDKLLVYKRLYTNSNILKQKINNLNNGTRDKQNEIKILSSQISISQNKLNSTFTIDSDQIHNLYINIILSLFVLLFVLRYIIYAVYSLNSYLK